MTELSQRPVSSDVPLCVDLDGTLIRSDLLVESAVAFVRRKPSNLFRIPLLLAGGRAKLKHALATKTRVDAASLPYRPEVLDYVRAQKDRGRRIVLATAATKSLADQVASHLGLFDEIIASSPDENVKGEQKRQKLVDRFGEKGFDYIGDSSPDLLVWKSARAAIVASGSASTLKAARAIGNVTLEIPTKKAGIRTWVQALRLHQWVKNVLVFLPLLTAHRAHEPGLVAWAVAAFFAYGLVASSVYVTNDLMDLDADRRHPRKRQRPLASGTLPLLSGLAVTPILLIAGFAIATGVGPAFTAVLAAYFGVTTLYTFVLKKTAIVDVICLAGLYTLRIYAGSAATGVDVSQWLLALSMFAFLSLAMVKRFAELKSAQGTTETALHGRGYTAADAGLVSQVGVSAGHLSVLVFALYLQSDTVRTLYRQPQLLWFVCVLLFYWFARVWLLAHRGAMHDDPVVFAVRDRTSYVVGALSALLLWAAT